MTLQSRLTALATAVGADIKNLNSKIPGVVSLDSWHTIGAAGQAAFGAPWTGYTTCQYRKDPFGKIHMRGLVRNTNLAFAFASANAVVFTLPVGYRPGAEAFIQATGYEPNGTTPWVANVRVLVSGEVRIESGIVGSPSGAVNSFLRLDEIEFDTDTVTQFAVGAVGPQGLQGLQGAPGSSVQVPMDTWHVIGAADQPVFQNNWVNLGGSASTAAFRKYPDGKVRLRGGIKSGVIPNAAIFTLPVGYRPLADMDYAVASAGAFGRVVVEAATGNVYPQNGSNVTFFLNGVEFDTETVNQFAVGPQGPKGDSGSLITATDYLPSYNLEESRQGWGDVNTVGRPDDDVYIFTSIETNEPDHSSPSGLLYSHLLVGLYAPDKVWRRYKVGSFQSNWVPLGAAPFVSALPSNPIEGQEIYFQNAAMAAEGIAWRFRYVAAITGPYKWVYVGGPTFLNPASGNGLGSPAQASQVYADFTTPGPSLTLPLAGIWDVEASAFFSPSAANYYWMTPKFGAAAPDDNDSIQVWGDAGNEAHSYYRSIRRTIAAAATVVKLQYKVGAGTCGYSGRVLGIRPVRVG